MNASGTPSNENTDAYGRRNRFRAFVRNTLRRPTRRLMWTLSRPLPPETQFVPAPPIEGEALADFAARATWYLGSWSPRTGTASTLEIPSFFDPAIDVAAAERPYRDDRPTHRLVWKVTPRTYLAALAHPRSVTIVDPSFAKAADTEGYMNLVNQYGRTVPPGFAASSLARRLSRWDESSALVLGTGPSAGTLEGDSTRWTYRLVCNSAIRNRELMERLAPTHICFGDPVFHFGPSAYAGEFRRDLREVAERHDSLIVVPDYCAGLIAANLPWTKDRLLPQVLTGRGWFAPTVEAPEVRTTGNILTQHMVPLAITLARSIDIGGADGRKPEEKYFWAHSPAHQYSDDLMRTVFEAHPAFFRDTDYADYYADHCRAVEELLAFGEERGCEFRTVTNSYIPALASRMPAGT